MANSSMSAVTSAKGYSACASTARPFSQTAVRETGPGYKTGDKDSNKANCQPGIEVENGAGCGTGVAPLRADVRLFPGPRNSDGVPSHVLHDPAVDGYFHIGAQEFEILARWDLGDAGEISNRVCAETTFAPACADVEALEHQLRDGGLLRGSSEQIIATVAASDARQPHPLNRLVNELLFKRLPLVRPQRFLDRTAFLATPFFMRAFWWSLASAFVIALYLVGRQFEQFTTSLFNMVSLSGAVTISIVLVLSKTMHELAHGYATRRYGADVPVMGIAFILFWPLLYTETSHAWTLARRRHRIIIASAGVAAELALAAACFIAWPFLDPGALRDAAGFAATTLIVLSIAFNANPLMKFDGYFVLSEVMGIENMQPRGFEILKWHLRKLITGIALPYPEIILTHRDRRFLLFYGAASAVYRIFLFGGIVYALNLMLFPALALPLSVMILSTSLGKPVARELWTWMRLSWRGDGPVGIARVAMILALLCAPLFIPWRSSVQIGVAVSAGEIHEIFATESAQIQKVHTARGQSVDIGGTLLTLASPDLDGQLSKIILKAAALDRSINRQLTGSAYHDGVQIALNELAQLQSEISGLKARRRRLRIKSPAHGTVAMLDRMLRAGIWVDNHRPLIQIVENGAPAIDGFAEERDIGFISRGARVRIFIEGLPVASLRGAVLDVYPRSITALQENMMSVGSGGPIKTREFEGRQVPVLAIYKVKLEIDQADLPALPKIKTRGYAIIETSPRNIIGRVMDRIIGLWRRELG